MHVLVLGSGAREHALARALARSRAHPDVLVAPGNDGMRDVARTCDVPLHDLPALSELARRESIDLTIAGSEEPLVRGVWDLFDAQGQTLFGPSAAAAQLEGSKWFAKEFMRRTGIPTAPFRVYDDFEAARREVRQMDFPVVIKADGLAAGKGVQVAPDPDAAEALLRAMLVEARHGEAGRRVLVETMLRGPELSVFAISDGYSFRVLGAARDAKRAYDGDRGPNTGGMGAYAPVPGVDAALLHDIEARFLAPTFAALVDLGIPYRGFLYLGLMLTESGPQLLEYNCRLGDPEAQVLLPRLRGDFLQMVAAAANGDLGDLVIEPDAGAAVGVVLASEGYPETPRVGRPVLGLEAARATGAEIDCAGLKQVGAAWQTTGGRICTVVGRGEDLAAARRQAYDAIAELEVAGSFYRGDIAAEALEGAAWPSRASAS